MVLKQEKRNRRHKRVRSKIFGTAERPRLCVFRSPKHIYGQLINDEKNRVIAAADDFSLLSFSKSKKKEDKKTAGKISFAFEVGKLLGEKALKQKIKKVIFDRGGYKYHGRVKALAEGAREKGLEF